MKNVYLSCILLSLLFVSCGGGSNENTGEETSEETDIEVSTNYKAGKNVYDKVCFVCHQTTGMGIPKTFPPLAGSDYLLTDKNRAIEQVLNGSSGEIVVNGETYVGIMPPQLLTDKEVKDVINYVLNSWGNDGGEITLEDVQNAKHPN